MTEETGNTQTESQEVTTEQSSEETQQVDTQSTEQADTTQNDGKVTESLAIEAPEEIETSSDTQPTIDDIVNEALSGELSEDTQKLIDENGLGKHIDMLVEGHRAIQEKNNQQVFDLVGGEDSYKELQEWGTNNLSEEQREAFSSALFSGNMELAKLAVQGLHSQYIAANGKAPDRVIESGGSANESSRPFADRDAYFAETRTIEYQRDPEYRAKVEAKRNLSGF